MKETTKYWITNKVINGKVVTLINTRLNIKYILSTNKR